MELFGLHTVFRLHKGRHTKQETERNKRVCWMVAWFDCVSTSSYCTVLYGTVACHWDRGRRKKEGAREGGTVAESCFRVWLRSPSHSPPLSEIVSPSPSPSPTTTLSLLMEMFKGLSMAPPREQVAAKLNKHYALHLLFGSFVSLFF